MDKITICNLLESFEELSIDQADDSFITFSIKGMNFALLLYNKDDRSSCPIILLRDNPKFGFPHVMLKEIKSQDLKYFNLPLGSYRFVCLQETESVVNSIIPYEEKVIDSINRLIELLSMTEYEKEKEYHKEFSLYWNQFAVSDITYSVFLREENNFSPLKVFFSGNKCRLISQDINLSDIDSLDKKRNRIWIQHVECDSFYIPIIDCREVLPPHLGYSWTPMTIKNIVSPTQIRHISQETYQLIKTIVPKRKDLILVFGIPELRGIVFALKLICTYNHNQNLFKKLTEDVQNIEILYTQRKDYLFLNKQIGNDTNLLNKRILLIGAGSLGSYVATELVKNGASNIKIYDEDSLQEENILRWACGYTGIGNKKVHTLYNLLKRLHPEVNVNVVANNIDKESLIKELNQNDLIIFTIGSSDEQLNFNRILHEANCSIPTMFVWLEAGGVYSHILYVNYKGNGCYECLFTDDDGSLVNNRSSLFPNENYEDTIIRNGCGGTRAAYGTAILLRTTSVLLEIIGKILANKIKQSMLIDISPNNVSISDTKFPEEECDCCGHR